MKNTRKKVHYVDNKKFYEEILKYRAKLDDAKQKGLDEPRIPEYIGECIYKIAEKLSTKPCFVSYSFRDEMISDGYENCLLYFKDYNPAITQNPFAYFTQIIYFAFIRRINKEEKNRYIIYKNFQSTIIHGNHSQNMQHSNHYDPMVLLDDGDRNVLPTQVYDNINTFIDKFEKKEEEKKKKRKQAKEGLDKFYKEE